MSGLKSGRKPFRSILIINPFGIGDVLFSLVLASNLKQRFPSSKIFYLCNRRVQPILESQPLIDKVFVYERDEFEATRKESKWAWFKKIKALISEIKKEKIEVVFDLSLNRQFGFFAWAAGIKKRLGYNYKNRGLFLTKTIELKSYKDKHVIEYYLDFLKLVGLEPVVKEIKIDLPAANKEKASLFLEQNNIYDKSRFVIICPGAGASWGKDSYRKHWGGKKFAQLADQLADKKQVKIVLAGSASEKSIIEDIAGLMRAESIHLIGLDLIDFLALLSESGLLITNDGGPLHMAVGLGVKTISIFGPVDDLVYGPFPRDEQRHIAVKKYLDCRPCYQNFRLPPCPYDQRCLTGISVDEVFAAAEKLLNG